MKIGEYELPDKCPENCSHKKDLESVGQDSICMDCPVWICGKEWPDKNKTGTDEPIAQISEIDLVENAAWLKEWSEFFKTGKEPNPFL